MFMYVYDGYIVITCYMKDHGYIEDYGAILEAIKSDNKKGKKKGGKGVRQGCGQAHQSELRETPNLRRLRSSFFVRKCLWDLFGTYFSDSLRPTKKLTFMTHLSGTCHRCCFCLL